MGIDDIQQDREHNFIIVGDMEVRGISIYENCLCAKIHNAKYFIDGVDMRNYKDASEEKLDNLVWRVKEAMSHLRENTKQLSGKDKLIEILTENNAEVTR